MLILDFDYIVDLVAESRVDEENESINLESPSLIQALEEFLQEQIVSAVVPLDSPASIVVEVDDPFADCDLLGQMRALPVQLTEDEARWICRL